MQMAIAHTSLLWSPLPMLLLPIHNKMVLDSERSQWPCKQASHRSYKARSCISHIFTNIFLWLHHTVTLTSYLLDWIAPFPILTTLQRAKLHRPHWKFCHFKSCLFHGKRLSNASRLKFDLNFMCLSVIASSALHCEGLRWKLKRPTSRSSNTILPSRHEGNRRPLLLPFLLWVVQLFPQAHGNSSACL